MICRSGLRLACTCLMVLTRSDRPSSAKYSHCIGTITPCAQHRPFSVNRLSDGGQSIRMKSYSPVDGFQGASEAQVAALEVDQFDFGAGQFAVGAHQFVADLWVVPARFGDGCALQQHVVDGAVEIALVDPRTHGGVALGIQVDQQHTLAR